MSTDSVPQLGATGRILEGIVTTQNTAGAINIAPMGPVVDDDFETFVLRPFQTSTTFENLVQTREGILQITDDVELFAAAAIGRVEAPTFLPNHPLVLANACRWFEFKVISIDDSQQRSCIIARTQARGTLRHFFGFNRAKHAVIEAAILATRLHILPSEEIFAELERLQPLVDKTGAAAEHRAFDQLRQYIGQTLAAETA